MKRLAATILTSFLLAACAGTGIPSVEDSRASISQLTPRLELMDALIETMERPGYPGSDFALRITAGAINRIMQELAGNRSDDIRVHFLPARRLISEKKHVLGIPYTNYIDIDTGYMSINFREFRILHSDRGTITAFVSMSGEGNLDITGKYTAIKRSARPVIRATLEDSIRFHITGDAIHGFALVPEPDVIQLHATVAIDLLGWEIPYSRSIPLRVDELIEEIRLPLGILSQIPLPVPNDDPGSASRMEPAAVEISRFRTDTNGGRVEIFFDAAIHRTATNSFWNRGRIRYNDTIERP